MKGDCREFRQILKKKQPKNISEVSIENEELFNTVQENFLPLYETGGKKNRKKIIDGKIFLLFLPHSSEL